MKKIFIFVLFLLGSHIIAQNQMKSKFQAQWDTLLKHIDNGLVDDAFKLNKQIINATKSSGNIPEYIKAVAYQVSFIKDKEEDGNIKAIAFVEQELVGAKFPAKNLLSLINAELYSEYYNNNLWNILKRTDLDDTPLSPDIKTWTHGQFFEKTRSLYDDVLANELELQKIGVDVYDPIIIKTNGRHLRPTLYDFLAFEVFNFYKNEYDRNGTVAQQFVVNREDFFADVDTFLKIKIEQKDTQSSLSNAFVVIQKILSYRKTQNNNAAFIDADLIRLEFVVSKSVLTNSTDLYLNALTALEKKYLHDTSSTEISYKIAKKYEQQGATYEAYKDTTHRWMFQKALEKCEEAITRFPKSYGAKLCTELINQIKTEKISFVAEEVVMPNKHFKLLAKYKNLKDLNFEFYKITYDQLAAYKKIFEKEREDNGLAPWDKIYSQVSTLKVTLKKHIALPQTLDYQDHSVEIPVEPLQSGLYLLFVKKSDDKENKAIVAEVIQVSGLTFMEHSLDNSKEIYVLNNKNGKTIKNAKVEVWKKFYDYNQSRYQTTRVISKNTDDAGKISLSVSKDSQYGNYFVNIFSGDDALYNDLPFRRNGVIYPPIKQSENQQTTQNHIQIITDRAIYRPGQVVHYKIIAFKSINNTAQVIENLSADIKLNDVNYQEINKNRFTTGAYGSAHGSFVLPASVLTGNFTLQVNAPNMYGHKTITVEEYKRPKFEAVFEEIKTTYKLNDTITVALNAKSFAGANLDNVKVNYKVTRSVNYPFLWQNHRSWFPQPESKQISIGETITDASGKALIKFKAVPDEELLDKNKAIFNYEITADVTDINGETHSTSINTRVGKASFEIQSSIPEKVYVEQKDSLKLNILNLNGQLISNTSEIEIQSLVQPQKFFKSRYWEKPSQFLMSQKEHDSIFPDELYASENEITSFPMKASVYKKIISNTGIIAISPTEFQYWSTGAYCIHIKTRVDTDVTVEEKIYFYMKSQTDKKNDFTELVSLSINKNTFTTKEPLIVNLKSQEKDINVFYQYASENTFINKWLDHKNIKSYQYVLKEAGKVGIGVTYVWNNRKYQLSESIHIENEDQKLDIKFETFRDKLLPGQKETWKLKVSEKATDKTFKPEVLAMLFDASLDQFVHHTIYFNYLSYWNKLKLSSISNLGIHYFSEGYEHRTYTSDVQEHKQYDFINRPNQYMTLAGNFEGKSAGVYAAPKQLMKMEAAAPMNDDDHLRSRSNSDALSEQEIAKPVLSSSEKPEPQIRKNFQETAFFYPDLSTDSTGNVYISFTIPEALTRWRMLGMAHTKDMKLGFIENTLVTQKDLMVSPNVPRFFRENDIITLQSKINNLSNQTIQVTSSASFTDALTGKNIDALLNKNISDQIISIGEHQSGTVEWTIKIPEGLQAISYKVTATTDKHSDAEENTIVVLSNKMLVTETMPLNINSGQEKTFTLEKLSKHTSSTLKNHKLTFEYTSNPSWYAIQALPYLMEYPYECAEQVFSRFYANDLAQHMINQNPMIKRVFDNWRQLDSKALLSNLEKNQELKNLMIEETPWLREASNETEAKRRLALLFDINKMSFERISSLQKLQKMQMENGAFTWFTGMQPDRYITQHILASLGHLAKIKGQLTKEENDIAVKAIKYLDNELLEDYKRITKQIAAKLTAPNANYLDNIHIHQLYARSFFKNIPNENAEEAYAFFLTQEEKFALKANRYAQGMAAITLHRNNKRAVAEKIVNSISQYALEDEEMGMYWKENQGSYWYEAPVETHVLMIEMYTEITEDTKTVDKLKLWLLKQKQVTHWSSTKATADACYALLMKGTDFLSDMSTPEIMIGNTTIEVDKMNVEAGTGYFKLAFDSKDIKPEMGKIKLKNTSKVPNWGALYWQYFENIDKITSSKTSLTIDKKIYINQNTEKGNKLIPLTHENLAIGDLITVRMIIKTDRNLEYVHLKDTRSAGLEPVNVLSGYRWENGIGYYESTRDASTNFFINYLHKGTYVFEYKLRVSHKGDFSNGIAQIQCMYAPEFAAHSMGQRLLIEK